MNVGSVQFGRSQLTNGDLSDMEKAIKTVRGVFNTMTITDMDGKSCSVQYDWDSRIYEVMEAIHSLLGANGFHTDTIKSGMEYMVHEFYGVEADGEADDDTPQAPSKYPASTEESSEDEYKSEMIHLIRWISENCSEMDMLTTTDEDIYKRYLYRNAPRGVCKDCGEKHGDTVDEGCTWWRGLCTWCGELKELADEFDFGTPKKVPSSDEKSTKLMGSNEAQYGK